MATPSGTPTPEATVSATPTPPTATGAASPTPEESPPATPTGEALTLPSGESAITLTSTGDGVLAYEIDGVKYEKFFGFIKVMLKRKVIVSAETGELLGIDQDLLTKLLDLLSF
jgi:hypothetical protein